MNKALEISSVILDMDGVLWRGDQAIGDLHEIFRLMKDNHISYAFATNNSTKHINNYVKKLTGYGIQVESWQIINSSLAISAVLKNAFVRGTRLFVIGEKGLVDTLEEAGFVVTDEKPDAVVVGMDRSVHYDRLAEASMLIQNGIPFYGTNADLSFPVPGGFHPGTGAILRVIEVTTGIKPTVVGKPEKEMIKLALDRLNANPEETIFVGDRLETDILGGKNAGCLTGLVLSGVATLADVKQSPIKPDIIANDLDSLIRMII